MHSKILKQGCSKPGCQEWRDNNYSTNSQFMVKANYLDETILADAILDRLTARSHRIELKGESRRKKK
ncbi:ATP-binding protein [Chitinophaga sancti]|uniref:ATP-binding protein n=1 Tax=Chitinophaga sancti TaxID=1004 RepID=A0ABZ0XRS7_9BACT|nr:ATP-binding protein [Chitinophaga sancti]WQG93115.1 ATP-binding protein [Chitinophaga sancti]